MLSLLSHLPILGSWRALLDGEVHGRLDEAVAFFWRIDDSGPKSLQER